MVADAGSFSHFMLRSSSALADGDSSAEAAVPRTLLPSNAPVRVHSVVVNWRRLMSCMGITPEGFTCRHDTRFRSGNTPSINPLEYLLPVSVPQWWVYDILRHLVSDRGRHVEASSKMIRTLGAPREHQSRINLSTPWRYRRRALTICASHFRHFRRLRRDRQSLQGEFEALKTEGSREDARWRMFPGSPGYCPTSVEAKLAQPAWARHRDARRRQTG